MYSNYAYELDFEADARPPGGSLLAALQLRWLDYDGVRSRVGHEAIDGAHDVIIFEDIGSGQTKLTFIGNEMQNTIESGQLEGTTQILDKLAAVVEGLVANENKRLKL